MRFQKWEEEVEQYIQMRIGLLTKLESKHARNLKEEREEG